MAKAENSFGKRFKTCRAEAAPRRTKQTAVNGFIATRSGKTRLTLSRSKAQPARTASPRAAVKIPAQSAKLFARRSRQELSKDSVIGPRRRNHPRTGTVPAFCIGGLKAASKCCDSTLIPAHSQPVIEPLIKPNRGDLRSSQAADPPAQAFSAHGPGIRGTSRG